MFLLILCVITIQKNEIEEIINDIVTSIIRKTFYNLGVHHIDDNNLSNNCNFYNLHDDKKIIIFL